MPAPSITPSSTCSAGSRARSWSASARWAAPRPTPRAPRTATTWTSPRARSAWASRPPSLPRSSRTTCASRVAARARGAPRTHGGGARGRRVRRGQRLRGAARRLEAPGPERLVDHRLQSPEPRRVVADRLFSRIDDVFRTMGWRRRDAQVRQAAAGGVRAARRRRRCATGSTSARTRATRRSPTRAAPPGASSSGATSGPGRRHPRAARRARRCGAPRPDDQPGRPRHGIRSRGVPRRRRRPPDAASSPTPSRATACRSPATRTTTPD